MKKSQPIGIMGSMPEEISLLKEAITSPSLETIALRDYISGELFGLDTVLVHSRWGKVASAVTASTLINHYNVKSIIFTGVAGAASHHLNIGDVVIADHLYQHDMNASPLFDPFEIPFLKRKSFQGDPSLSRAARDAAQIFIANNVRGESKAPSVYQGTIASGDQFISDAKTVPHLPNSDPTLAVEMEGAAVAQVCFEYGIPFTIIRIISDKADHEAAVDFQTFVSQVASHYTKGIIENLFLDLSESRSSFAV